MKPIDPELMLRFAIPHCDSSKHVPLVLLCLWVDSHCPGHTKEQQKHDDVGGIRVAHLGGQEILARSPDDASTLLHHQGVAKSFPEVPLVKTRPRAAMMICSRRETKLRHRLRTKVRVRFTTAEKLNLDTPP